MKWHYGIADMVHGPVSDERLLELVRERTVCRDTLVWAEYLVDWVPAEEVEGLFETAGIPEPASTKVGTLSPWAPKPELVGALGSRPKTQAISESEDFARIWEKPAPGAEMENPASRNSIPERPSESRQKRKPIARPTNTLASRPRKSSAASIGSSMEEAKPGESGSKSETDYAGSESPHPQTDSLPVPPAPVPDSNPLPELPSEMQEPIPSPFTNRPKEATPPSGEFPKVEQPQSPPALNPHTQAPPTAEGENPGTAGIKPPQDPPVLNPHTQAPPTAGGENPGTAGIKPPQDPPVLNPHTQAPPTAGGENPGTAGIKPPQDPPVLNPHTQEPPTAGGENPGTAEIKPPQDLPALNPHTQAPPTAGGENPGTAEIKPPQDLPALNPHTQAPPTAGGENPGTAEIKPPQDLPALNPHTQAPPTAGGDPVDPEESGSQPPKTEGWKPNPVEQNTGTAGFDQNQPASQLNPFTKPPTTKPFEPDSASPAAAVQPDGIPSAMEQKTTAGQLPSPKPSKSSLPEPKSSQPEPLAKVPGRRAPKSAVKPALAPTSVQRGKSGVTAPLKQAEAPDYTKGSSSAKPEPEPGPEAKDKAEASKKWKRPEMTADGRSGRLLPLLAKVALLLALSAGSGYGIHTYRSQAAAAAAAEIPEELPPPPPVEAPAAPRELALADHLSNLGDTATERIVLWNLKSHRGLPSWVKSAPSIPLLESLRAPCSLPGWILEGEDSEAALVASIGNTSAPGQVIIVRFSKESAAALSAKLPESGASELAGGNKLITVPSEPGTAAVFLDDRTIATGSTETLRALYDQKSTTRGTDFQKLLAPLQDAATVVIVTRETGTAAPPAPSEAKAGAKVVGDPEPEPVEAPVGFDPDETPQIKPPGPVVEESSTPVRRPWRAELYEADTKIFTIEQVTLTSEGLPASGAFNEPVAHPDVLLGRVLLSEELESIADARRYAKTTFPEPKFATIPSSLFVGSMATDPATEPVPPQPFRYLPDFYRALASHNLKKMRQNPEFEAINRGEVNAPHYWHDINTTTFGLEGRDLDQILSCASELGTCHVIVSRFPLTPKHFGKSVDLLAGYTYRGLDLYPIEPRTSGSPYLCIAEGRVAVIAPSAMLERILRDAGSPSALQPYMEELYPQAEKFEESVFLRVEGRTGDVRYQGVQALFFGENFGAGSYGSQRIVKCRTAEMAEEFNRLMRRRRDDAATEKIGTSVADLVSVGINDAYLVVGAQVPLDLWETYTEYFKNVILPEG